MWTMIKGLRWITVHYRGVISLEIAHSLEISAL